jgi:hypothetical protein
MASILWRRIDFPGHDACRLLRDGTGWILDGVAVFADRAGATHLKYRVTCDATWRTQRGYVEGWIGERSVQLELEHVRAAWTVNGVTFAELGAELDLDLAFTPATNLTQLRRLDLSEGEAANVPVAWLDVSNATLSLLPQRYERRSATTYWYEAPSVGYRGLLVVDANGFVVHYPGLWEAEPSP